MGNNSDNGYRANIVYSMLDADKIIEFKKDFFDDLDGKSGKRASEFIKRLMKN